MDSDETLARLAASIEALGELREAHVAEPDLGFDINDTKRYAAAIAIAASALDDAERRTLAGAVPSGKASLDIEDLDLTLLMLGELLSQARAASKGGLATKALWLIRPDPAAGNSLSADNLRESVARENRAADAARRGDDQWIDFWLAHGRQRLAKVEGARALARAGADMDRLARAMGWE